MSLPINQKTYQVRLLPIHHWRRMGENISVPAHRSALAPDFTCRMQKAYPNIPTLTMYRTESTYTYLDL
jgi:hypothetical protein